MRLDDHGITTLLVQPQPGHGRALAIPLDLRPVRRLDGWHDVTIAPITRNYNRYLRLGSEIRPAYTAR
ncbi:hypothetical protein ACFPIJ_11915 [Dactylosporangium cerinum]|uniref:Uncharacterized protein n=1 Tax=Dactylosporangium cerinum TaxID=1434730 RepID=A0ABV9VSZ6_9ACTN